MRGLLLLMPVLSCALALAAYIAGSGAWTILAAFFIAGPVVVLCLGLLGGRADDPGSDDQGVKNPD